MIYLNKISFISIFCCFFIASAGVVAHTHVLCNGEESHSLEFIPDTHNILCRSDTHSENCVHHTHDESVPDHTSHSDCNPVGDKLIDQIDANRQNGKISIPVLFNTIVFYINIKSLLNENSIIAKYALSSWDIHASQYPPTKTVLLT